MGTRLFHCHWYVTTRCNSHCKFCSIWSDPKYKSNESSISHRLHILSQLKQLGVKSIDFTGGEPLLYPHLPELIRQAHYMGFFTSLTTNGTLYPQFAEQLRGNLSSLSFSLDAADSVSHNRIRGIDCYSAVIQSIIRARQLGELVMLKTTVCQDTIKGIPSLIDLAAKLGVLIELNAEFSYFHNPQLQSKFIRQILTWSRHPNVIISHTHLYFMLNGGNDIRMPKCRNGSKTLILSPDDRIFWPCMHQVEFMVPLQRHDIKKTIQSSNFRNELPNIGRYAICERCTIPCYMEPAYYTVLDKYFVLCLFSRLIYLKKRIILTIKIHAVL